MALIGASHLDQTENLRRTGASHENGKARALEARNYHDSTEAHLRELKVSIETVANLSI
jgi:hypothetical protein